MIVRIVGHNNEAVFPFKSAGPWDEFYKVFVNNGIMITAIAVVTHHGKIFL